MATYTKNYRLEKPDINETADIEVINGNMEIIDTELKKGVVHSLATAAGQFLVSSTAGQFVVKTIAEVKSLLGLGSAAYKDVGTAGGVAGYDTVNSHLSDYVRQPGYAVTSGTANTYTANLNPAPSALIDGMGLVVKIHAANTGTSTLNVNGLGAKPIIDGKGRTIQAGKLLNGRIYSLKYDGANFQLQGEGGDIPKLPNLIKNGSFENDFNSWTNSGFLISGSYPFNGIKAIYASHTGQVWWTCSQQIKCNVGDKIYAACRAWVTSASYLDSFLIGIVNLAQTAALGDNGLIDPAKLNQWQFLSTLGTATDTGAVCELVTCSAGTMWADGVMAFNLTQAFGAGNEPSKEEMDYMVAHYGNWWDSDLPLLTSDATAISSDIIPGKIAYGLNGLKCIGTSTRKQWASNNEGDTISASGSYGTWLLAKTIAVGFTPSLIILIADSYMYGTTNAMSSITSVASFNHPVFGTVMWYEKPMTSTSSSESYHAKIVQTGNGFQVYLWILSSTYSPTWLKNARWVAFE
ncbi:MAG TPA: hypothetical protein VHP38_05405 [Ruminiclostridium sp.]|nr:hypothetical protein [Ruminiclostridium sp.]